MPINKPHLEFHGLDMESGWATPPGYPPGIQQKILAGALDEAGKTGCRTRLLRFAPGAFTTEPFIHDYWEEVFLVTGDLIVGEESFNPMTYACRPPGASHGPFRSVAGCILYENHSYDPA